VFEGILTYKTEENFVDDNDTVNTISYYIKGNKIATVSQSDFGGQKYIRDTEAKTGVLMLKMMGEKFALTQDLRQDTVHKKFMQVKTKKKEKISGLKSQEYLVSGEYLDSTEHVYVCKKISGDIISIYGGMNGLPTKYRLIVKNEPIQYELIEVKEQAISDDFFKIPADYQIMTMQDFLDKMANGGK
jgi:hypothetical protein